MVWENDQFKVKKNVERNKQVRNFKHRRILAEH